MMQQIAVDRVIAVASLPILMSTPLSALRRAFSGNRTQNIMHLMFTSKDPGNTTILTPLNQPLYTVSSTKLKRSTTITRATDVPGQGIELASIKFHTLESDRIVLHGREFRVKDWIHRSGLRCVFLIIPHRNVV